MTIRLLTLVGLAAILAAGCTAKQEPATPPKVMAEVHFVGAKQAAADPQGTTLKKVGAMAESKALLNHLFNRVSEAPAILGQGIISSNAAAATRPVLNTMAKELWDNEFALILQGAEKIPTDYTLAVRLDPNRLGVWRTNIAAIAGLWNLGTIRQGTAAGLLTMEVGDPISPVRLRWVESGDWGLLGVGTPSLPGLAKMLQTVGAGQRPVPELSGTWLEASIDLQTLAPSINLPTDFPWPHLDIQFRGDGENVRSSGTLTFPEDVTGPLEAWQVPTNIVTEPLITFSAARGIAPLLEKVQLLKNLGLAPAPNRLFTWGLQASAGQVFMAFPMPGLTNQLPKIAQQAPDLIPSAFSPSGKPDVFYDSTNHTIVWRGTVPIIVPSFQSMTGPGGEYAVAGLFPSFPVSPPPAELLNQLAATNLIHYSWEITEHRIKQWLMLTQLGSVMSKTPQMSRAQPALPWLQAAAPLLGNSATEIVAESPRKWSFNRKSQIGLSGPELVLLARWIESVHFPLADLEVQPSAAPVKPGVPAKSTTAPAAKPQTPRALPPATKR
jgi:hypothetical protein